jgi:hypothetical protein
MWLHKIKSFIFSLSITIVSAVTLAFMPSVTYGQAENKLSNHIDKQIALYRQAHPSSLLFVHFDKTLYTNNDNVWFTAYLLNCAKPQLHNTLSVSLVNDIDHKVEMDEKFIMGKGVALGNLHLSDSIPPGNYTFMVYTNRMINNKPEAIFTQPITVKTTVSPGFKAILSLSDTSHALVNQTRQVSVIVNGSDYLPISNAVISYRLSGKDTAVIEGKAKTDKAGLYTIRVPAGKNLVKVQVKDKKSSQYLYLPLPENDGQPQVKFYPEGGNLINNLPVKVGWETTTGNGQPLKLQGVLYENNKAIDTIQTDSYGMGNFTMLTKPGNNYYVKLAGHTGITPVYKLHVALPVGFNIAMPASLANDTLILNIRSSADNLVHLNIHNYRQHFFSTIIKVNALIPRKVKIPLSDLPKGLAAITLTDSLGRPYAERLFFAHFNQHNQLTIEPNKEIYNTREKVQLKLKLRKTANDTLRAVVSVACVQENRIELKKANDIESYVYLKSMLNTMPLKQNYLGDAYDDRQYLENILLIKGWRKYLWTDMLNTTEADTNLVVNNAEYTGKVSLYNKAPKKPISFIIHRDSSTILQETDASGNFKLNAEQLMNVQDKKVRFIVNPEKGYEVQLNDPYKSLNNTLAKKYSPINFEQPVTNISTDYFAVKGLEHAIQLRAVTVKTQKDNTLYGAHANACGDYVCMYNILNCSNHVNDPQNKLPVAGWQYRSNQGTITYTGCNPDNNKAGLSIRGIYEAKQFYGADYAVVSPTQPEYLSTLFWSHLVSINSENDTDFSFYTGDITGRFKIVVQGITTNGVTYSESSIVVKKP